MEPVQYVRALRQWWWVIVAAGLIGAIVAVVSTPNATTEYSATNDLIFAPAQGGTDEAAADASLTVDRLAFLATRGDVLQGVAEELGEAPADLKSRVTTASVPELGSLSITATGSSERDAAGVADAFAAELIANLDEQIAADRQEEIAQLQAEVDDLSGQIAPLDQSIDPLNPDSTAVAQRDALTTQYTEALGRLRELSSAGQPNSGLSSVEPAIATLVSGGETSGFQRVLIAALVGLLIGVGLALVLTRFDTRIRTKEDAEEAFGLPVIAEVPLLSLKARKRHDVISIAEPASPGAEAYRGLRTSLVFAPRVRWSLNGTATRGPSSRASEGDDEGTGDARHAQTILVVSPGVGEGKSTTVANLAVAFAESGKYVLVVSGDLRRPMIDRYLGVEPGPGVSELLADDANIDLQSVVRATSVADVRMIPSGEAVSNPGELLSHHGAAMTNQARNLADVVLIDSPPLLATDDASPLLPHIDDVLVVCRAGVTTAEAGRRTSELLRRLDASVAGVALVGAMPVPTVRGYYRAYGAAPAPRRPSSDAVPPTEGSRGDSSTGPSRAVKISETG